MPAWLPTSLSEKEWCFTLPNSIAVHPNTDSDVREIARRKGFFDYRALMRANLAEIDSRGKLQRPNLFVVMVTELLYHCPVTVSGGTVSTIGALWEKLLDTNTKNQDFRSGSAAAVEAAQKTFDDAVEGLLPKLKVRGDSILSSYFKHRVTLRYGYARSKYRKSRAAGYRDIQNGNLWFDLAFNGLPFSNHEEVLNEAKLSAVALAVYFAGLLESVPAASSAPYPKILVLDDVLIGLDMSNRLPVLDILATEFAAHGWQIILLTHDQVWYDYAKHASSALQWACHELYADNVMGDAGMLDKPLLRTPNEGAGDYLTRAEHQLTLHDHKAAAMYARGAYELILKKHCEKRSLPIPFKMDSDKTSSNTFFDAVRNSLNKAIPVLNALPVPLPTTAHTAALVVMSQIELHRQQVLNPLSHSPPVSVTKPEVEDAIKSVRDLDTALQKVPK